MVALAGAFILDSLSRKRDGITCVCFNPAEGVEMKGCKLHRMTWVAGL